MQLNAQCYLSHSSTNQTLAD